MAASQRNRARNPIGRAFEILSWLSAAGGKPAGPREIARGLGMTPSTVHRLLAQLEEEGLVRSLPEGTLAIVSLRASPGRNPAGHERRWRPWRT